MAKNNSNKNWFPKVLTAPLLSVLIGALTGVIVNLLTSPFPIDQNLVYYIASIVLFLFSTILAGVILNIRNEIDDEFSRRMADNKGAETNAIWEAALSQKESLKCKFIGWKIIGILTLIIGIFLMIWVNYSNYNNSIKQEKALNKTVSHFRDSLQLLDQKVERQTVLIQQLTGLLHDIQNELDTLKHVNSEGKRR